MASTNVASAINITSGTLNLNGNNGGTNTQVTISGGSLIPNASGRLPATASSP